MKFLKSSLSVLGFFALWYLGIYYVVGEMNPKEWHYLIKAVHVFLTGICSWFSINYIYRII